jgi:formylglycine-generating enzyme required for sulfatase activity
MNHRVRQALSDLISRHGLSLSGEPKRCRGLLLDCCPENRREIFVLMSALEERVVRDLLEGSAGQTWPLVAGRLVRRLAENRAMTDEAASWAVESWALALGVVSEATLAVASQPRPPAKPTGLITERTNLVQEPAFGKPGWQGPTRGLITSQVAGIRLRLVQAGGFSMGSSNEDSEACSDEKPDHGVWIDQPFYLGITPVTQAQFEAATGRNPSHFRGLPDNPVVNVTWYDAVGLCNRLSKGENLPPYYAIRGLHQTDVLGGPGYRLPSEAEWEYACRAGTQTRYYSGEDAGRLGGYAWFAGNSGGVTRPVRQKRPNAWGLYDMHGNVWEWCGDFLDEDYYRKSPLVDPLGPGSGSYRVMRGGSWMDGPPLLRAACRCGRGPEDQVNTVGFRVARGTSSR